MVAVYCLSFAINDQRDLQLGYILLKEITTGVKQEFYGNQLHYTWKRISI